MHTQETQQKFIERRAQGWSFTRIAGELGVAKSTLVEWSRKFRFEINNRRAIELDELHHRILGTCESRVAALAQTLSRVEEELRKRDLTQVPTARLYSMAETLRRQIERETGALRFVTPVKDIPNDEYVEQVQEWTP
jgi:two-component sensor histidine kinase